jgi:hypothetical protein
LDCYRLKNEIINFVLNSPEEVNSKVAVFIAGMQAQKNLMGCERRADEYKRIPNEEYFTDLKTGPPEK